VTRLEVLVLSYSTLVADLQFLHFRPRGLNAQTNLPLEVRREISKFIDMQTAEKFFTYGFKNLCVR